mgnify:FL=1
MIRKPETTEYNAYFQRYVDLVLPGVPFEELFRNNTEEVVSLFGHTPGTLHDFRYAEDKWTVKQMLMHIIDTERVFSYRMLVAARQDPETPLHRMNENFYASHADVSNRSMEDLLEEFRTVRKAMEFLFTSLTDEQSRFMANAVTYKVTARALAWITVGHASHHMNILKERYLSAKDN